MRRHMTVVAWAVSTAILAPLAACTPRDGGWTVVTPAPDSAGTPVHITGVVRHVTIEGGAFTIQGDDGVTYNASNLPVEFQKDGLRVEADGRRRDDMMSIQMVGPIVQIVRVRLAP